MLASVELDLHAGAGFNLCVYWICSSHAIGVKEGISNEKLYIFQEEKTSRTAVHDHAPCSSFLFSFSLRNRMELLSLGFWKVSSSVMYSIVTRPSMAKNTYHSSHLQRAPTQQPSIARVSRRQS